MTATPISAGRGPVPGRVMAPARAQRRGRLVPTRTAFFAALAVLVVAVISPAPLAVLFFGDVLLVVTVLLDCALACDPAAVGVVRTMPSAVALGGEATIEWAITNPSSRVIGVSVADELAPSLAAGTRRLSLRVPAGGTLDRSTVVRPTRRGRFVPAEVVVRVRGPLGLGARQHGRLLPGELRVLPRFASRAQAELRVDRAHLLQIGLRASRSMGGGTEFEQLRDWTPDDETRRIDWAATARTNKPIVRTYRAERNQTVITLLDTGRTMAGTVDEVPRVEHAMDAVMLLTYIATRLGDRAGLVCFGSSTRAIVPPSHRANQLGIVTEAMFDLFPELAESDYRSAFAQTLGRFRRRALLVVLTDLNTQAVEETLLPALPLIARSHLVIVGAVRDPQLVRWADAAPIDAGEVYRTAAAQAELDRRARLAARLRGLGAIVVDAAPGQLAPALGDAYLDIKARGRL